ncbi:terpenoid cyclases/protein prenyltransferase alpha-alpha toroid [Tricladium varicosporioides]|nr:terpenoid cyclases/protein prenyltransferase alpha-alpha toroid [Hymenoscyphus varicosporioides]
MAESDEQPKLNIPQHIKYWHRCLNSLLPTQYTSTDSSRMTLGFFILSALDLLSAPPLPLKQNSEIRSWILKCQHPHGGFCGSPNHRYPDEFYGEGGGGESMDPANLPATFFALLSLSFVGGLEGVQRGKCLAWLKRLQRSDGSFGELVTTEGEITGGYDMRHCYVLAAVRWILRGDEVLAEGQKGEDINVEALVGHLKAGQTYDGGISESSSHEAHAGYMYCAVASSSLLNRLPNSQNGGAEPAVTNLDATIKWLVSRQVAYEEEDEDEDLPMKKEREALGGVYDNSPSIPGLTTDEAEFVGFNGRCNKSVDTCYAFWATASLDMLGENNIKLVNTEAIRRFLFEQTQHRIGGFGKYPGSPPDIYHSYLGLAALAVMKEPGLKPLDSALCISKQQRERISKARAAALVPTRTYWKNGFCYSIRADHPDFETKIAESEEPPRDVMNVLESSVSKEQAI